MLGMNKNYFVLAILLTPLYLFFRAYKWYVIAKFADKDIRFGSAFLSYIIALGFGVLLPSKLGEFTRAHYVSSKNRLKLVGCVIIDEVINLIVVGMIAIFGVFLFLPKLYFVFFIVLLFIIILLVYYPKVLFKMMFKISRFLPWRKKVAISISEIKKSYRKRIVSFGMLLSVFSFLIIYIQGYLLIIGLGGFISLKTAILTFPIISLAKTIPITIAGLGLREGAAILLFTNFGVPKEIAMNMALLWFIIDILVPGIIGLMSLLIVKKK